jgi:thymidylate kinase
MTIVISLFGSPGSGKSTNACRIYTYLKDKGFCVELVTEYVKQWAWEKREQSPLDQFYFFAKQARQEYTLFDKVDYIITDSPVALSAYYSNKDNDLKDTFKMMLNSYHHFCKKQNVKHINIFLNRVKPFDPKGRYHTEKESDKVAIEMKQYLQDISMDFIDIDGDEESVMNLLIHHLPVE